jgi:hypothetical protein
MYRDGRYQDSGKQTSVLQMATILVFHSQLLLDSAFSNQNSEPILRNCGNQTTASLNRIFLCCTPVQPGIWYFSIGTSREQH